MKRRSFLKGAALAAAGVAAAPVLRAHDCASKVAPDLRITHKFNYGPDGTFKLLQLTDTHYIAGDSRSERALRCVEEMIALERPDFVIHTGDIVFGKPDIPSAIEVLRPLSDSGIPWAVALGNHDSQFGSTRQEMFQAIRDLPGCVNLPPKEGIYGCSNDVVTLGHDRAFYLFDSMDAVILRGEEEIHCYDYIRHSQIAWYRAMSDRLGHIPALAFFHIPLPEVTEGLANGGKILAGTNGEPPCPSRLNSGLLAQFREMGDVQAIVNGHDHDCDYVLDYGQMYYIYGRFSGCDTIYNHLGPDGYIPSDTHTSPGTVSGCRVFEFREGDSGFHTWVRLCGGAVQQKLTLGR